MAAPANTRCPRGLGWQNGAYVGPGALIKPLKKQKLAGLVFAIFANHSPARTFSLYIPIALTTTLLLQLSKNEKT